MCVNRECIPFYAASKSYLVGVQAPLRHSRVCGRVQGQSVSFATNCSRFVCSQTPLAGTMSSPLFYSHCNETGNEIGRACVNENAVSTGARLAAMNGICPFCAKTLQMQHLCTLIAHFLSSIIFIFLTCYWNINWSSYDQQNYGSIKIIACSCYFIRK